MSYNYPILLLRTIIIFRGFKHYNEPMHVVYVQVQSTRLVTPHSLWPTKTDTWRLSNISLKNISVTQNVRVLQSKLLTF